MSKTTILHAFFYISPPSLHNYGVKWSNVLVNLRRERQRDKFYYLSLNVDTVHSLQFQPNVYTLSHWATWCEGEKVLMHGCEVYFSATFSLGSLLSDHKVLNGRGTGRARETRVSLSRAPFFLAFLVLQRRQGAPDEAY